MKGQLTIEYLISFTVFIGLISYVYLMYSRNIPNFMEEIEKEEVRSKTYQLSELLVNDPGKPNKRIGLSNETANKTNLILKSKIDNLNNTFDCLDDVEYKDLQNLFALDRQFLIEINDISQINGERTELFYCLPSVVSKTGIESKVTRLTAYNDGGQKKIAEIIVQMW